MYPPVVPPATRTNATPSVDNHPADHNAISNALSEIINHIAVLEQTLGPIGSIIMWATNTPPTNYLLCQGQSLLRTDYPDLFAVLGTTFGGDATHFNLPDYRGRMPCGVNQAGQPLSAGVGERFGSYDGQVISHAHGGVNHLHSFGGSTAGANARHNHNMNHGEVYRYNPYAPIGWHGGGSPGNGSPFDIYNTNLDTNVDNQDHGHAFGGSTAGADRDLTTTYSGVAPGNANIPPVLTAHFAMRAR